MTTDPITSDGDCYDGPMISGGAAITWARWGYRFILGFLALAALLLGEVFRLWGTRDGAGFWVLFWCWGALGACSSTTLLMYALQDVRESRHGYTTSYRGRRELPQVDPATRRIVRAPGAPYITVPRRQRR